MRVNVADKPSQALLNAQKELEKRRRLAGVTYHPPRHSGSERAQPGWLILPVEALATVEAKKVALPAPSPTESGLAGAGVRVAPTLAAHCLDKDHRYRGHPLDAPYRLYKILQALDHQGRGWLTNNLVEATLTSKASRHYIYGRRQLKNILQRGEDLFWQRTKSKGQLRIRLVARAKVARRLLNDRLRGREVSFPLLNLLGSGRGRQAAVNATLYTAVHAGQIARKGRTGPISRAKLRDISGCSSYRQRHYEKRMGITVTSNFHILGRHSAYRLQQARIHEGLPAYKHTDYRGKINRHQRGTHYIARRLPNSFSTPETFTVIHSRRQRTMNRQLGGLCLMGSEGSDSGKYVRLFHENAVSAVHSFNHDPQTIAYCPLSKGTKTQLWRTIT